MIRRWLALTYYLYALWLTALSHFDFNPLYLFTDGAICRYEKHQLRQIQRGAALPKAA